MATKSTTKCVRFRFLHLVPTLSRLPLVASLAWRVVTHADPQVGRPVPWPPWFTGTARKGLRALPVIALTVHGLFLLPLLPMFGAGTRVTCQVVHIATGTDTESRPCPVTRKAPCLNQAALSVCPYLQPSGRVTGSGEWLVRPSKNRTGAGVWPRRGARKRSLISPTDDFSPRLLSVAIHKVSVSQYSYNMTIARVSNSQ